VGRAPPLAPSASPGAYDPTNPAHAAKLDAADAFGALAGEAGMTLIQMSIAFVTPALSAAFRRG